jgi:hypothetical protein
MGERKTPGMPGFYFVPLSRSAKAESDRKGVSLLGLAQVARRQIDLGPVIQVLAEPETASA